MWDVSKAWIVMCVLCQESRHIDHPDAKASRRACYIDYLKNKYLEEWMEQHSGLSVGDEGISSGGDDLPSRQLMFTWRGALVDPLGDDDHLWLYSRIKKTLALLRRSKDRRSR